MTTPENKKYTLNLSSQMILGILLSVLVPISGAVYYGITLFNDLTSTIEEVKKMSNVETRITLLEDRVKAADNRMIELAMSNNRAYEKASEAFAASKETSAITKGSQREIDVSLNAVREEMKALRKSTINPLAK
jgi:hypothetical protein